MSVVVAGRPAPHRSLRGPAILIVLASLVALAFFAAAAAPYLLSSSYNANQYAGRRGPLLVHIVFGTVALFSGPIQLWFGINRKVEFDAELKPAFYYNEVTMHFRVITKKFRTGTIKGSLRWQYEFLIPKYPIGTFSIYSCLGEASFRATPRR